MAPRSRSSSPPRVTKAPSYGSEEYEEDPSTMSIELPRYTDTVPQSRNITDQPDSPEHEILADEDGGRFFCAFQWNVEFTPYP